MDHFCKKKNEKYAIIYAMSDTHAFCGTQNKIFWTVGDPFLHCIKKKKRQSFKFHKNKESYSFEMTHFQSPALSDESIWTCLT